MPVHGHRLTWAVRGYARGNNRNLGIDSRSFTVWWAVTIEIFPFFLSNEPKKQHIDTFIIDAVHQRHLLGRDSTGAKFRTLFKNGEREKSLEFAFQNPRFQNPSSFPFKKKKKKKNIPPSSEPCISVKNQAVSTTVSKKVALTVARGKTRWPGKNTNVQSPLFEKIQYPTPFKKGRKKERKKRKGSSPSKFVEKSNVWTMIHAINAWQTTAEKVFSQSRCEGERKEERVSGGRFKPGFESNSSVSLSRYMPEEGVFRSRYGQRWIDK